MHTSTQLFHDGFRVEIDGRPAALDELTPDWHERDRFGIVVRRPFGSIGASLLIQLAVANFYAVRPERRGPVGYEYPEIHVFHMGGPHGDHSWFDFWPPRKECLVPDADPVRLLAEIDNRGITRLAVPDGPEGDLERLTTGSSTWADLQSARGRLTSCFAYSEDGQAQDADVTLYSTHPKIENNITWTLDPIPAVEDTLELLDTDPVKALPGPSRVDDVTRWAQTVHERLDEVPAETRQAVARTRSALLEANGGLAKEGYRRISTDTLLRILATG